jgi:protein tyrosine phosphatase (PTP) superfamily phosphohydrolase (DUF442 family)
MLKGLICEAARTLSPFLLIFLFAACIATASDQSPATQPSSASHIPAHRITVVGVSNFGEVTPHLFRGGQPKLAGYKHLKQMGIDLVIDLRLSGEGNEKKDVNEAGMEFVSLRWHCMFPHDSVFAQFLKLLRENRDKKIFVHCRYGDDRTGMMIAAYRMADEGWTPEEARKEMEKFGFHRFVCPRLGPYEKHFPEHLKNGSAFKDWRHHQVESH